MCDGSILFAVLISSICKFSKKYLLFKKNKKLIGLFQFADFKRYATSGSLKEQPELSKSVALFNGLSQWVQCMVLCKTTPQQRADVMTKFVSVAQVTMISLVTVWSVVVCFFS